MIIGITGNIGNKEDISNFFRSHYNFKYYDIDNLLEKILVSRKKDKKILDYSEYLEVKNELDRQINLRVQANPNEIIVLDYSILEDSYFFDKCQTVIKVTGKEIPQNAIGINKIHRQNTKANNDSTYHLIIDLNSNWQQQLKEYIDYNFFHSTKVTVVVPIFNTIGYISKCVQSIINQTYKKLEIILINDGSTDKSPEMCNFLSRLDSRIKVVNQDNVGLAETRNNGIKMATGEYIMFIDSDDYIDNRMIETLLKTAEKTNADVCESGFYIHMKDGCVKDVSCEQKGIQYVEGNLNLMNAYSDATILIPAWDKLFKLSAIRDIKFDKNCFKEDADYIYRLCMAGKTFSLVPIPFYHYIKRKSTSITGAKISPKLFSLQEWGFNAYDEVLARGEEYKNAAEKILYNSLVHILRNFMRDYKNGVLEENEFSEEIQEVVNNLIGLLLTTEDVSQYRKLEEVLNIINELINAKVLDKSKMPTIDLNCIGILWNSLNEELMQEAIAIIEEYATIYEKITIDLKEKYRDFIKDIYFYNHEFEGVPIMKAGSLIDRYDSNTIMILSMIIRITNYTYYSKSKGFMLEEVARLKSFIRKTFKSKIRDYAYDNIFHLTVDQEEYEYTSHICKKYIPEFRGNKDEQ